MALFHLMPPEKAHAMAFFFLKNGLFPRSSASVFPELTTECAGLHFPNPLGLAAGFDKNAEAPHALMSMGFGFVECGAVTPRPQQGSLKPRLFRLSQDRALINRMGFNNEGASVIAERLDRAHHHYRESDLSQAVIGLNIGANKETEDRPEDYKKLIETFWGKASYFSINISSPNTPHLRELQSGEAFEDLAARLMDIRRKLAGDSSSPPFFLKIAPDLDEGSLEKLAELTLSYGFEGLIVSNTTTERPSSLQSPLKHEKGGLSGPPLFQRSTRTLRLLYEMTQGRLVLIGAGGIDSAETAYQKIRAGASALQLYTALIYEGPSLIPQILQGLSERLKADGFKHIKDAVGTAAGKKHAA